MSSEPGDKRKPGRPVGTGPVARLRQELLADGKLEALTAATYKLALEGHPGPLRILWERAVPALRTQAALVSLTLPTGSLTEGPRAAGCCCRRTAGRRGPRVDPRRRGRRRYRVR